jgi:hypothetical protein
MVRWIFSHIIQEQIISVVETQVQTGTTTNSGEVSAVEGDLLFMGRLHLGARAGASFNVYQTLVSGGYEAGTSQGLSANGVLLASFKIFKYLGIQAEVIFNYDTFKAAKMTDKPSAIAGQINSVRSTDRFSYMSLMFPFMIKVPLDIGKFTLSPFVGIYYVLPLGKLNTKPGAEEEENISYSYTISPPLGLSLGIDAGYTLGPGEIFLDLRYNRDIGMTVAERGYGIQYVRNQVGLSLGYKFLLWDSRKRR